jgi:hypothetical protein
LSTTTGRRVPGELIEDKNNLHSGAESGILNKGAKNNMLNMADTGGRRNEKPLTAEQINQAKEYAVSLGMPEEDIIYDPDIPTCYAFGTLVIGTDVVPLPQRSRHPNDNISIRGGIAHEVVGHREAELQGRTQPTKPKEEAQASIRAARFAPGVK